MNNNIHTKYYLSFSGKLYKDGVEVKSNNNMFTIYDDDGKKEKKSLKTLFRIVYKKEYCIDNIQNLTGEQWKEIQKTKGKYFISNKGRVKSLCGYKAILLQYFYKSGYPVVKINNKHYRINRLVAQYFCNSENINIDNLEIHHIDGNKKNNNAENLKILTQREHSKIHLEMRKK